MPLYNFECENCDTSFECILTVSECDEPQQCHMCGSIAKKVIILGHGGIFRTGDSLPWIRSVGKVLTDGDNHNDNNIQTIQDLRQYYRDHPNVIPVESHPALPSSLGDAFDKRPDHKKFVKDRSKKAHEKLRDLRRLSVG